jgi:hypothetical protein
MRSGELEADLSALVGPYELPEVMALIERKRATNERVRLEPGELALHERKLAQLAERLDLARDSSSLPHEPANVDACEAWLVETRRRELCG